MTGTLTLRLCAENEIDGSVLMDESFDESQAEKLVPKMGPRLKFIKEKKKLGLVTFGAHLQIL